MFVFWADFSKRGTSKDHGALTAAPSVLHLFATIAYVAGVAVWSSTTFTASASSMTIELALMASVAVTVSLVLNTSFLGIALMAVTIARAAGIFPVLDSSDIMGSIGNFLPTSAVGVAAAALGAAALASRGSFRVYPIMWAIAAWVYAHQGISLETCTLWEGMSTPCLPKDLLMLAAAVFAVYQISATWPGGIWAVAVTATLAFPAATAEGAFLAGAMPAWTLGPVHAAACTLLTAHAIGYYPLIATTPVPAAPSDSRWQATAGYILAAAAAGVVTKIGFGDDTLACAAATAAVAITLIAVFASRSAPLMPAEDDFARQSAVVAVAWACACFLAGSASSANFVVVGGSAAVTMITWAVLQLLVERDGPFFSNGVRMVIIDLQVLGAVVAVGFVAIGYAASVNGIDLWGLVQPAVGAVGGLIAALWGALPAVVAEAIAARVAAPVARLVDGQEAQLVAVALFCSTVLLRCVALYSAVPLSAHLAGEVVSSGKGMRSIVAITIDGAAAAGSVELVQAMEEDEEFTPLTFFATRKEMAAHPECIALAADCGHEVGMLLTPADVRGATVESIVALKDSLEEITGRRVRWVRTADGSSGADLTMTLARAGVTLVLWSSWPRDWSSHPDTAAAQVLEECAGYGRPPAGKGAVVRIVMDTSLVCEAPNAGDSDQQMRAADATIDVYTRFTHIEGLTIAPLSDVIPHRGFELEA